MSTSISFPQVTKMVDTLEEKGVTSELVQDELLGKGRFADLAEATVRGTLPNRKTFRKLLGLLAVTFKFIVDYTMSLADMVKAGGYDWVNSDITEANFPKPTGLIADNCSAETVDNVELFHFNRDISSEDAVEEMRKAGFRPATIRELLSFGANYSDIQRQFPIVALGSSCFLGGDRHVAFLDGRGSGRRVFLNIWQGDWRGCCRFLVVRN